LLTNGHNNTVKETKMVAPLIGIAIGAAAKMAAKKLATKAVKKKALSNTFGAKGTIKKQVTLKKKAAVKVGPKNSVKVVKPKSAAENSMRNATSAYQTGRVASGARAKAIAQSREKEIAASRADGTMAKPVKIKSGGNIKPAFPKKAKPMSYSQLKDMPNLVKIDSAKGNTVKKIAYRKRTSN
jgi:hypothetical protein